MDGYQFLASIIQSIMSVAWPAALVVCVWLFREKLNELLPRMHAKYKDIELSFRLDQAEKEVRQLPAPETPSEEASEPTPEEQSRFDKIAKLSPRAAILELRYELEEAVRSFAAAVGAEVVRNTRALSFGELTRILRHNALIDHHTSAALDDLRVIGNSAAHGASDTDLSAEDAARFRSLAERLISQFHIATGAAEMKKMPAPLP